MGLAKAASFSAALVVALTILTLILPELNKGIVKSEADVVEEVLQHFTQPELFALRTLDISGEWKYVVRGYDEGVLEELYRPDAPIAGWKPVVVPFMMASTFSNSTMWLRRDFWLPSDLRGFRARLVFLGAFYKAYVWLNGVYLGEHEGYFSPFFFDVEELLNFGGNNTLVVCLSTPVESDLNNKVGIVGVFNDWDVKPYPRWAFGKLPKKYEWVVPIGLWRPVVLAITGPLAVHAVLVDALPGPDAAKVNIRFYVSNMGGEQQYYLRYNISPYNFEGVRLSGSYAFNTGANERKWVEISTEIAKAALWWTWDQGQPSLYKLEYEIRSQEGILQGRGSVKFGVRTVQGSAISRISTQFVLNGRRVFLRGFNYISDFYLVNASREVLKRDLEMMIDANANFVRVHAHVEPPEFYELADEYGVAVQCDGPLIWAYASQLAPDSYESFVEKALRQFVEMVLLLYNHPSVSMWSVHNEPPWASEWMGDLYRRGVNRDLDTALAALIRAVDLHGRPVIAGSGYEDQHVYFGWFSGSWIDFLRDASPFPTEFGAQSLPSVGSPFWKLVNVSKWPIEEGDDAYYELAYRGFYWASGYVKVPYGLPSEYPSLEEYVKASQEYQAVLLKAAIARYRTLKFNATGGAAAFLFKDCFPAVSFSVVDYYGVPKQAYYVVKEVYKPLKVIVLPQGDFEVRGTTLAYKPNTTLAVQLWIVNDFPNVTGTATLRWRLLDTESGERLEEGTVEVRLPAAEDPAKLVHVIRVEAPAQIGRQRALRFEAALLRNGVVVDEDFLKLFVDPLSRVVINLEDADRSLTFYVLSDVASFRIRSNYSLLSFALPAGTKVSIVGPVYDGQAPYAPLRINIPSLQPGATSLKLKLIKGALYVVRLPTLGPQEKLNNIVTLTITPLTQLEQRILLKYGADDAEIRFAILPRANIFIIPAATPVTLTLEVKGIAWTEGPVTFAPGSVVTEEKVAQQVTSKALIDAKAKLRQAEALASTLERQGFYIGLTRLKIEHASLLVEQAATVANVSPEHATALLIESSSLLATASSKLAELKSAAQLNTPLLLLLLILASLGVATLVAEDESLRPAVGTGLLIGLGILVYFTYPGFSTAGTTEILVALYVSFFTLLLLFLLPLLLEGVKSEKGIPIFAVASSAFSIAARNLRRRGLRTGLTLLSIAAFSLAVTNLMAVNYYVSTRELVTTIKQPANATNIVSVFGQGALDVADVLYLSVQPEVVEYGFKVESRPAAEPYAVVAGARVRGFIGFFGYLPLNLSALISPPEALELLAQRSDIIIVSSALRRAGIEIGSSIRMGGEALKVAGFFDSSLLGKLKDVGGYDILPRVINPDGSISVAHPDEVAILPAFTALRLNGLITRIYATTYTPKDLKNLALRLSLRPNYVVVALPAGDYQRVYFTGSTVEYRGGEALLPIALVFINVASVVLASVFERKGEIVTLASIGMNPTHILFIFLAEAILLGFVGGALGYITGISAFRVLLWVGARLPVDVKTSIWDALGVIFLSTLSSTTAALLPALKASQYATPSLRRKWKLEAQLVGEEWHVDIPVRITAERIEHFVEYFAERLREEEHGIERAVTNVAVTKLLSEGFTTYKVEFTFSKGGGHPFSARAHLVVKPVSAEFYSLALRVKLTSPYSRFYQSQVQEVATFVRSVALEWASLKVKLLVPVGSSVNAAVELVRSYHPQLVMIVSRKGDGKVLRELRSKLRSLGLRPPATELVQVRGSSLDELVSELKKLIAIADIVALDSDDGLLSAALALTAALENRRVAVIREGRVEEVSVNKLFKLE